MIRFVFFGREPVTITPEQFSAMAPHVKTEAALFAREMLRALPAKERRRFGPQHAAAAIGADVIQFHDALDLRHAFTPFSDISVPAERAERVDHAEAERRAVQYMLMPTRAAARLLAWLVRQPGRETALGPAAMEEAAGLRREASRYALGRLQQMDLVERTVGRRSSVWRVTPAGFTAAVEAGLVRGTTP
jgi:hypothetical protein